MNSHTKHDLEYHLQRAQGHAIRLWNDHHIPCGFFFIDPKFRKPVIFASENIKLKLENYFDEDPDLMKAFDNDAETMNLNFSDQDYFAQPAKETFNRTRANFLEKECTLGWSKSNLNLWFLAHNDR